MGAAKMGHYNQKLGMVFLLGCLSCSFEAECEQEVRRCPDCGGYLMTLGRGDKHPKVRQLTVKAKHK